MCLGVGYKKKLFWGILKVTEERVGSGIGSRSVSQRYGTYPRIRVRIRSKKATDPQHCSYGSAERLNRTRGVQDDFAT